MKTVIITGGNSGLGYQCAKVLAKHGGWHIVIASRSPERTTQAVDTLITETGYKHIEAMMLDLASLKSVQQFASTYQQGHRPALGAIVCNAGLTLFGSGAQYSADGIELTFATNHLGHFLLVNLLKETLIPGGRVIMVSSGTHIPEHRLARITGVPKPRYTTAHKLAYPQEATPQERITNPSQIYSTSKLCNVLMAYELARREKNISVFVLDPGLMPGTGFVRGVPAVARHIFTAMVNAAEPLVAGIRHPEQSGQDLARLVMDEALNNRTALYFDGQKETRSSADSYDIQKASDLWETSESLVYTMLENVTT